MARRYSIEEQVGSEDLRLREMYFDVRTAGWMGREYWMAERMDSE